MELGNSNFSLSVPEKMKSLTERKSTLVNELEMLNEEKENIENNLRVLFGLGIENSDQIKTLNKKFDENKQKIQNTENELNNL